MSAIAGLRAIAVLAIVVYHIHSSWLPGGFVGVDIFFVISGFVVAHSVANAQHSRFQDYVAWFYKRRFQRILPAVFAYIMVASIAGLLFIPLTQQTKFFEPTGFAATFGLSNLVLWAKAGDYFASGSDLNPFTHTWSLAVEEQYYALFPFFSYLVFVAGKADERQRRFALWAVGAATILSLAVCSVLTLRAPTFAFYMLPTRFWELSIGFLMRVLLDEERTEQISAATASFAGALAAAAILGLAGSMIFTDPLGFPFPGALLPSFSTLVLLAVVWCHPATWASKLLSLRPAMHVGNISYSLYLWHWGVIVLMRWTVGIESLPQQLFAAALMLGLAELSYRYVELVFHNDRARSQPPSGGLFLRFGAIAAFVSLFCIGAGLTKPQFGWAAANDVASWDPYRRPPIPADCPTDKEMTGLGSGMLIRFPASCTAIDAPTLYILGDSHAGAYQRAAWRIAASGRYRVELLTLGGCRPVMISQLPAIPGCPEFLKLAFAHIKTGARPGDVLFLPSLQTTRYRDENGNPLAPRPLDRRQIEMSRARVHELTRLGPVVVIEGAKPVMPAQLYRCADWFNRLNPECGALAAANTAEASQRAELAGAGLAIVAANQPGVTVWEPKAMLCPRNRCAAYLNGKPLYFDTDHLSAYANDLLLPSLTGALNQARATIEPR